MIIGATGKAGAGKDTFAKEYVTKFSKFCNQEPLCSSENSREVVVYALAAPCKAIICDIFGWDHRMSNGYLKEVPLNTVLPTVERFEATCIEHLYMMRGMSKFKQSTLLTELVYRFTRYIVQPRLSNTHPLNEHTLENIVISPREAFQLFGTEVCRGINPDFWLDEAEAFLTRNDPRGASTLQDVHVVISDVRFNNEAKWVINNGGKNVLIRRASNDAVRAHVSEDGVDTQYVDILLDNNTTVEEFGDKISDTFAPMWLESLGYVVP